MCPVSRLRVLLLTLVVLAGQAHACSGIWVLPNGTECRTCPKGPCEDATLLENWGNSLAPSEIRDCHECCSLSQCEQDDQKSATAKTFAFDLNLTPAESALAVRSLGFLVPRSVHVQIESGFPNAPPSAKRSRAPPVQLS